MKRILLIFSILICFLPCFQLNFANASATNADYVVVANSATLFESADFSSQKVATLSHKDFLKIELNGQEPVEYGEEFVFYKAQFENIEGFVLADLVTPQTQTIVSIPNFNAKTNSKCNVFLKNDKYFIESETILEKHEQIFLYEGYDVDKEYTAITYVKDNEVLYGYLKTENIAPNGINPIIITCICIVIAVIGIVFAWVFMKNKKVKIKK